MLATNTRSEKLSRNAKTASARCAECGRVVKLKESSLNHTHGRSIAQQQAMQTAGVKTSFMS